MIFPQGILADLKALWGIHESWLFSKTGACGLGFRQRRVNPDEFNVAIMIESMNMLHYEYYLHRISLDDQLPKLQSRIPSADSQGVTVRAIRPLARAKPTNYRAGADPVAGLYLGFSGSLLISPLYGTCQFPSTCQGLTCPPSVDTAVQMPFGPVK